MHKFRNLQVVTEGSPTHKSSIFQSPMTPISFQDFEKSRNTPKPRIVIKKRTENLLIKLSPKLATKKDLAVSWTDRVPAGSIESSPSRRSFFKLQKPGDMRVTSQSFRSLNFSRVKLDAVEDEDKMITRILDEPLGQEKLTSIDEYPQQTCGKDATNKFYSHYKQLDKICDINGFKNVKDAMYTTFLRKSEDLCLLPSKMGLVRDGKGEQQEKLQINNYRIGDKYAVMLSEGLKSSSSFKKFELANNRLTPAGADVILSHIPNKPEAIDLSGNKIGRIGVEHLCRMISQRNAKLLYINLEGNKLGDYAINDLCEAIGDNETVKKLNLNRNFLTDKAAEDIGRMIKSNNSLQELYLRWNQIKGRGGEAMCDAMKQNSHIRVLDLSWNSLGVLAGNFAQSFASFISQDEELMHLDLSNNCIKKAEALVIAKGLEKNHTMYGFHFRGNAGYVDAKGFLIVEEAAYQNDAMQTVLPPISGVDVQSEILKRYHQTTGEFKDACWICEGWRPVTVKWQPGVSGSADQDPIYCHFSYEGYKGRYLAKKKDFTTSRMAPPVAFGYLFSVDENEHCCAEDIHAEEQTGLEIQLSINGKTKKFKPEFLNWKTATRLRPIVNAEFEVDEDIQELDIRPRVADEPYIPPEAQIERPKWKFQTSSFREYRPDNHALLDRCFEVDFENTRISKIVKNERDLFEVRQMLESIYKNMKDCYKHYAAIGAPSEIWSIPMNTYTEFCLSAGIVDGKLMKLSDFDRIFIATYTRTDKQRNPRNPERALVRYQFMEGLVRLADQKYLGNGIVTTIVEALRMLLEESVKPFISKFNHQSWRAERLWNEEVDCVIKSYTPILRGAYKRYSGLKTLPGQKKWMSLEEFNNMVGDMELLTDSLGERDATLYFSLSMMTQVDELDSDRIFQMQFVEFVEALCRVADKFSAAPFGKSESDMTKEQRTKQPLYLKLEGIMQRLFMVCASDIKDIWVMPEKSIFEMEEEKGKQRVFTKKRKIVRVDPTDSGSLDFYGLGAN